MPAPPRRSRPSIALACALAIIIGLTCRHFRLSHPNPLTEYGGDTLWPLPFFLLLAFARPAAPRWILAGATWAITLAIEFSQLAHPPWLNELRRYPGLGFMLGNTFLLSDVVCISAGIILCLALDPLLPKGPPWASKPHTQT